MKSKLNFQNITAITVASLGLLWTQPTFAKINTIEIVEKTTETQIRRLVEPLLEKYCHEACKLMGVYTTVDHAVQDELAPGFDDVQSNDSTDLAPSSARIKLLMDDKVGPVSRNKLVELVQQYLDTLEYPVKIETQVTHFPLPQGSEGKVTELRERISKQFLTTVNDLLRQFCPQQCMLADFDLQTEVVNGEEAQYGATGEFIQEGNTAIRLKNISATLLIDESLTPEEQTNILEMAKLKTNSLKHVSLTAKSMKFPKPTFEAREAENRENKAKSDRKRGLASEGNPTSDPTPNNQPSPNSTHSSNESLQEEIQKFKTYGLIFGIAILILLVMIAMSNLRRSANQNSQTPVYPAYRGTPRAEDYASGAAVPAHSNSTPHTNSDRTHTFSKRYEIERVYDELTSIYAQQPKVAKQVFSRLLTEEGVETVAKYLAIFGEGIAIEMMRDPSLQQDLSQLLEFYAKNPMELQDDEKLELLRKLHNRTIAGKLSVMGNRTSNQFDFLHEMDSFQIQELIESESTTIQSIVLTQIDAQKRAKIYSSLDAETRMVLLTELTRIEYLPKDFISTVATSLKHKIRDNPKLDTEALPGSEVLVSLLERTGQSMQKTVMKNLEASNPDSARTVKSKLISLDTLRFLRDGQLLEILLSLKHEELVQFLQGCPEDVRNTVFSKAPRELTVEIQEELQHASSLSRETYQVIERKILNKIKIMSNEGHINLLETNERMFSDGQSNSAFIESVPTDGSTSDMGFIDELNAGLQSGNEG